MWMQKSAKKFLSELWLIWKDILFVYKNFLHWNISKIISFLVSICIGFVFALPFTIIMVVIALIDPIDWIAVLWNESFLWQLQDIKNVFWSLAVFMSWMIAWVCFLLGSWFYVMFILRLSLTYTRWKSISRKKLLSFSKKQYFCFLRMTCLCFIYIFLPVFLWIVWGTLTSFLFPIDLDQSIIIKILLMCLYVLIVYITYKVQFSFLIFADTKVTKSTSYSALKYIKKSIEISKPKYFIKFIGVMFLYFIILLPFRSIDTILESQIWDMSNTFNYRNELFTGLTENDRKYLDFIAADYESLSDDELISSIETKYRLRLLHFIVAYILFGGLVLLIMSSFYRRILLAK